MTKILITNDDGISADGIYHLYKSVENFKNVKIIAPLHEQSGKGLAMTLNEPLHVKNVAWENNHKAYSVSGTTTDCVKLALSSILEKKPDIILSGINNGSNSGKTVLFSGTIGGIIEGIFRKIPGIAFSCFDYDNPNYELFAKYVPKFIDYVLNNALPENTFLNINFPSHKIKLKGIKFARQGSSYFIEEPEKRLNPNGHPYYWLGGKWLNTNESVDSDVYLLSQGYITVVPIYIGDLTHNDHFHSEKTAFEEKFNNLTCD